MIFNLECIISIRYYKDMIHIKIIKLSYSAFSIFSNVREVNLVYPCSLFKERDLVLKGN